ncbi:unnamed protein product [Ascophyllum nodosum]
MGDPGPSTALAQRCNMCWKEANGACFRTQCGHLFCESCAFQHFGQSQSCPSCGVSLEEADITDLTLGLAPSHFSRMVFQEIYKDPDFRSMGQSVVRTAMALNESVAFVLAQMTLEGQRAAESDLQLKTDLAKQRHENGRLTMQLRNQNASMEQKLREADHKLRLREKELVDLQACLRCSGALQEAYKEKSRKCQAWEKAYGNLRSQVTNRQPSSTGGFTPPESPRAGLLRGSNGSYGIHNGEHGAGSGGRGATPMQQRQESPQRNAFGDGGSSQRPDERIRPNSPHSSSLRTRTFLGRGGEHNSVGGIGGRPGAGASWSMSRPPTYRGGGSGDRDGSPILRTHQAPGGFSHSITPSPTFPAPPMTSGRSSTKRPETPLAVRGYYARNTSPSNRAAAGGGTNGGGVASALRGRFFPMSKSNTLF